MKKGRIMKNSNQFIAFVVFIGFFIASCSTTKNLKEGQSLYVDGHVDIESDTISKEHKKALATHLEQVLMPKPNKTLFGWRYKLAFNNMAGDSVGKNFIRRQLKKNG